MKETFGIGLMYYNRRFDILDKKVEIPVRRLLCLFIEFRNMLCINIIVNKLLLICRVLPKILGYLLRA